MKRYFCCCSILQPFKHLPTFFLPRYFSMYQASLLVLGTEGESVVATHSGKHSEAQSGSWSADRGARIVECGSWSAVDYTGGPKAESPLSQGPRPAFENLIY